MSDVKEERLSLAQATVLSSLNARTLVGWNVRVIGLSRKRLFTSGQTGSGAGWGRLRQVSETYILQ